MSRSPGRRRLVHFALLVGLLGPCWPTAAWADPCDPKPAAEGLIQDLEAALAVGVPGEGRLSDLEAEVDGLIEDLEADGRVSIDLSEHDTGEVGGGSGIPVQKFLAQAAELRKNKWLDCKGRAKLEAQGVQWGLTLKSNLKQLLESGVPATDARVRWLSREYRKFLTGTTFPASAKAKVIDYGNPDHHSMLALMQRLDPKRARTLQGQIQKVANQTRLPGGAATADLRALEAALPAMSALAKKELIDDTRPGTHTDASLKGQLFIAADGSLHHALYGHLLSAEQVKAGKADRFAAYGLDPRWTRERWEADYKHFQDHMSYLYKNDITRHIGKERGSSGRRLQWGWEAFTANVISRRQYMKRWNSRCQSYQPSRLVEMNQEAAGKLGPIYKLLKQHYNGVAMAAGLGAVAAKAVKDGAIATARKLDKTGTTATIMAGAYELIDGFANKEDPEWVAARIALAGIIEQTRLVDSQTATAKLMKQLYIASGKALQKAASEQGRHGDTERAIDEAGAEFVNQMVKYTVQELGLPEEASVAAKTVFGQIYDHLVAGKVKARAGGRGG